MLKRHEVLFNQLSVCRHEILKLVEDLEERQADIILNGYKNSIRWQLGHVYVNQFHWLEVLTKERIPLPKDYKEMFLKEVSLQKTDAEMPSLLILKRLLAIQPFTIRKLYGERMEEEHQMTELGIRTVEQMLVRTIFHEGIHLGKIQAMKRTVCEKVL